MFVNENDTILEILDKDAFNKKPKKKQRKKTPLKLI